mgnify:CR=1 FL=1
MEDIEEGRISAYVIAWKKTKNGELYHSMISSVGEIAAIDAFVGFKHSSGISVILESINRIGEAYDLSGYCTDFTRSDAYEA